MLYRSSKKNPALIGRQPISLHEAQPLGGGTEPGRSRVHNLGAKTGKGKEAATEVAIRLLDKRSARAKVAEGE